MSLTCFWLPLLVSMSQPCLDRWWRCP